MAKKPIVRNITDEKGWWPYDSSNDDGVSGWSSHNSMDEMSNMDDGTRRSLIRDLIAASLSRVEQKKITEEDVERLSDELKENSWETLESISYAIRDAYKWAWEAAYIPQDLDIEKAMERVGEDFGDNIRMSRMWELITREVPKGPREWSPRKAWSENDIFRGLAASVAYKHKPNDYDRYFVFDWFSADPVVALKETIKTHRPELLDFFREMGGDVLTSKDVDEEVEGWIDNFIYEFFERLDKRMQGVDVNYRVNFGSEWKKMLKDKQIMDGVGHEILEFLEMGPREWLPRGKPKKEEAE